LTFDETYEQEKFDFIDEMVNGYFFLLHAKPRVGFKKQDTFWAWPRKGWLELVTAEMVGDSQ
jgi:hypothetical protein